MPVADTFVDLPLDANADLVRRARDGDTQAWKTLVDSHAGLVWSIIRTFAIGSAAHDDVFQTVWLRLAESLDSIREPDRLAAWLARVARNEAVGVYRRQQRVQPRTTFDADIVDPEPGAAQSMISAETRRSVRAGLERLGGRCRRLLTMLTSTPPLSYEEVADLLEVSVGSIGPNRARCLSKLKKTPELQQLIAERGN